LAKVVWTQEAELCLKAIHDYIAKDKPEAAFNVVVAVYRRAQELADFPSMGQALPGFRDPSLRVLLWGHYRIVYRPVGAERIDILGVFHGAMDLKRHFRP
jgi:toxin ParE1/3/4